jgi:hypothetical protein
MEIQWSKPKLDRFKVEYQKAVDNKKESFVFEGNEFVTGYAKYLIEYLNATLK